MMKGKIISILMAVLMAVSVAAVPTFAASRFSNYSNFSSNVNQSSFRDQAIELAGGLGILYVGAKQAKYEMSH